MIYLFNEMMIEMGCIFNSEEKIKNRVFHIDSRDSVGRNGWTDELHARPDHFMEIGTVFIDCIRQTSPPDYKQVYVVKQRKKT